MVSHSSTEYNTKMELTHIKSLLHKLQAPLLDNLIIIHNNLSMTCPAANPMIHSSGTNIKIDYHCLVWFDLFCFVLFFIWVWFVFIWWTILLMLNPCPLKSQFLKQTPGCSHTFVIEWMLSILKSYNGVNFSSDSHLMSIIQGLN